MIMIARRQVVARKAQLLLTRRKRSHVQFTVLLTGFAAATSGCVVACAGNVALA